MNSTLALTSATEVPKNMSSGTHFVMYYDCPYLAWRLQHWNLLDGLIREENAVYVTHGDPEEQRSSLKAAAPICSQKAQKQIQGSLSAEPAQNVRERRRHQISLRKNSWTAYELFVH